MNYPKHRINFQLLHKLYGSDFAETLWHLGVREFLDVNRFIKKYGAYPDIASIWLSKPQKNVEIQNGTLKSIGGEDVIFGRQYYLEDMKQPLISYEDYKIVENRGKKRFWWNLYIWIENF